MLVAPKLCILHVWPNLPLQFVGCCLATKCLNSNDTKWNGWRWWWMRQCIDRSNINKYMLQMYSPQMEQQAHAVLSGNVTIIKFQNITDTPKITLHTCSIRSTLRWIISCITFLASWSVNKNIRLYDKQPTTWCFSSGIARYGHYIHITGQGPDKPELFTCTIVHNFSMFTWVPMAVLLKV